MEKLEAGILGTVFRNEENGWTVLTVRAGRSEVPGETRLVCRRGDELGVRFQARGNDFTEVYLTGPAELLSVE